MEELTKKQQKVLEILKSYVQKNGESPTLVELKKALSDSGILLKSLNSLVQYLNSLEDKGYIQKLNKFRGVRLLEKIEMNFIELPLYGVADCGAPLHFAEGLVEDYVNISKEYIGGNKNDYFLVKAFGDSMDKEGIDDSDYVLVRKFEGDPENGDTVLAIINGLGTIKKFRKEANTIALLPHSTNKKHQPVFLHPSDQVFISGIIAKVFKFSVLNMKND